jgi:NADH dehydrogenase
MPLRVWLGAVWVFEGIVKIVEGWFSAPMLNSFFGSAAGWYDKIINAATGAAPKSDTVTAATGAAAGGVADVTGKVLFNIPILGLVRAVFVCGKDPAQAALSDYAFKLDIPLLNSFLNATVLKNDSLQVFTQVVIVLAEILIGLALVGGLFSTPASALSLVLQAMFVTTTGLYLGTFWMIFAAIAVLIGSGRTFGLDYYAIPALSRAWSKIPFVRKSYLYHD